MILRLSVRDAATLASLDVEISAEPDSTVASLLDALPMRVGSRTCYVGGRPLDRRAALATSPLIPGALISIGAPGPEPRGLPASIVGALRVFDGPDTGKAAWLSPGTVLVGRSQEDLRDPKVSQR